MEKIKRFKAKLKLGSKQRLRVEHSGTGEESCLSRSPLIWRILLWDTVGELNVCGPNLIMESLCGENNLSSFFIFIAVRMFFVFALISLFGLLVCFCLI